MTYYSGSQYTTTQTQHSQYDCLPSQTPQVGYNSGICTHHEPQHKEQYENSKRNCALYPCGTGTTAQEMTDNNADQHSEHDAKHNTTTLIRKNVKKKIAIDED